MALLAALLVNGCRDRAPSRDPDAAPAVDAGTTAAAVPAQIDEPPVLSATSQVVRREDIAVDGRPACAFEVRYAGMVDQPVTWQGERCADLGVEFLSLAELAEIGQADKLGSEARDDLARLPDGEALYIEGEFSSALYPANVMGRVYEVPLAD